ncbi:dTMP kinase [soil metagenome]
MRPREPAHTRGRFISFEGTEGCGKSTQIQRLIQAIERAGQPVHRVREPGGTPAGEVVRELLQHAPEGRSLCAEAELLLFAASRAQLVREVVAPALAAGTHVVADRFLDSTTAYQGDGRGLDADAVAVINALAVGGNLPDVTVLLDLDWAAARQRVRSRGGRPDRMEDEPDTFFQRVRDGFLRLAAAEPDRIAVFDASQDEAALARAIQLEIGRRCHGIFG